MSKSKAPAEGDRIDLGGKIPQFYAFTHFAYKELLAGNLAWIRVADVKADKLDDIQYATNSEIHAYQMKWSNQASPPAFTYLNFLELIPDMVSGWKALTTLHANEHKKLYVHMITNRKPSVNDEVKDRLGNKVGTFKDFLNNVYTSLKNGQKVAGKWLEVLAALKLSTKLNKQDFFDFFSSLTLNIEFQMPVLSGIKPEELQKQQDFNDLSRLLIDEVADKKKQILYTKDQLVSALKWEHRFKTTFQHEFFVDKKRYQPITTTVDQLNKLVDATQSGYVFLSGSPGSGKSTLLSQWIKGHPGNVIKYYAFSNISISQNYRERGDAANLFFDLVVQLQEHRAVTRKAVLPYHDETFLRSIFFDQLKELREDFLKTGTKTIIVIDGLDHIPREYQTLNSLLGSLPPPSTLPPGIVIILGSQTYELEGLQVDVKNLWKSGTQNIQIDFLDKKSVFRYIDGYEASVNLTQEQKEKVFELTKGHPLLLAYLLEQISGSPEEIESILGQEAGYGTDIESYYQKIWDSINDDADLKKLLGLIARISGEINPAFVQEWGFSDKVLGDFRKKAFHLFSKTNNAWVFFHNSFRQFIIKKTSISILTDSYDEKLELGYHSQLADLYLKSVVETHWNRNFHLYKSSQNDQFLKEATAESFLAQMLAYRPIEKIRQDMRLGVMIADETKDEIILVRYLFMLSELSTRVNNFNPIDFAEEHMQLNNLPVVKRYLRDDHILNCNKRYALSISQDFYLYGDLQEAKILYTLAEPDEIVNGAITVQAGTDHSNTNDELEEWASAAVFFEGIDTIISTIRRTTITGEMGLIPKNDTGDKLKQRLFYYSATSLLRLERFEDFDKVLAELDPADAYQAHMIVMLYSSALRNTRGSDLHGKYLDRMTSQFSPESTANRQRIKIAQLLLTSTGDKDLAKKWLDGVPQPDSNKIEISDRYEISSFRERIDLNTLLNMTDQGISPEKAVPIPSNSSDGNLLEFERMLCRIAQIHANALRDQPPGETLRQIKPIIEFYYQKRRQNDINKYTISRLRKGYFEYLINSVQRFGPDITIAVKDLFLQEFSDHPEHWDSAAKSEVLFSLIKAGIDKNELIPLIEGVEPTILTGDDMAGRVNQCREQVSSWLAANEPEKAEVWMHRAISESLSIGYRKDYQLNTWLNWLEKANEQRPEMAAERINVFLSRLRYVRDVTETSPFYAASKKVLQVTYKWNFGAGVETHKYMLDKGLIHFEDGLEEFIRACIRQASAEELPMIIEMFHDLLLDISAEEHTFLFRELLEKLWSCGTTIDLTAELTKAIAKINVKALNVHRSGYFQEIVRFSEITGAEIKMLDIPAGTSAAAEGFEYDNSIMLLADHETLKEAEVLEKVTDYSSLKTIFLAEDKGNSHFNWSKTFEKVKANLTVDNIKELAQLTSSRNKAPLLYYQLSNAAFDMGERDLARELAHKAIDASSSSGWDEFYDGGSRLNGFKALEQVDGSTAFKEAFTTFCDDLLATQYPDSYKNSLKAALPVISETSDVKEIYPEVDAHVKNLLSNADQDPDAANALIFQADDFHRQVFDLLTYFSKMPSYPISTSAKNFLATHIKAFDVLKKKLTKGSIEEQELFLELMMANRSDLDLLREYEEDITGLTESSSFNIQQDALVLSYAMDEDFEPEISDELIVSLSPVYQLDLTTIKSLHTGSSFDEDGNVVDTEDVGAITSSVRHLTGYLANRTGFNELNIQYRLFSLMKEIEIPAEWSSAREIDIRKNMDAIGIKTSFNRPRVKVVLRALSLMLTELMDAGLNIPPDDLVHFIFKDVDIRLIKENAMPLNMIMLKEKHIVKKEWLAGLNDYPNLKSQPIQHQADWTVIAEYHKQIVMEWGFPTETYQAYLRMENASGDLHRDFIFGSVLQKFIVDSTDPEGWPSIAYPVAINDHRFITRDVKTTWIGFNPFVAGVLEWEPDGERPLAWRNNEGELMVESIYWKNGNSYLGERVSDCTTGEGWFVQISEKGLQDLLSLNDRWIWEKRIERNYSEGISTLENKVNNRMEYKRKE
jgi:hypothetical protein